MIFHENCLQADNSHEIACLICYFWKKSSNIWNCRLLQIVGGAEWDNMAKVTRMILTTPRKSFFAFETRKDAHSACKFWFALCTYESRAKIWPVKWIHRTFLLLLILCLLLVPLAVGVLCFCPCLVMQYLVFLLFLQSFDWGRESWLLYCNFYFVFLMSCGC